MANETGILSNMEIDPPNSVIFNSILSTDESNRPNSTFHNALRVFQFSNNNGGASSLFAGEKASDEPGVDTQQEGKSRYIEKLDTDARKRLEYLLNQAEIYSHFMSDGDASKTNDERCPTKG